MKKLVLFGDSITAGYGPEAITSILPDLIGEGLGQQAFEAVAIINAGVPGDNTVTALKRLEKEVVEEQADIVTLLFGANDVSIDRLVPLRAFVENLEKMVEAIGPEKVILITPPYVDSRRNPSRTDDFIQLYAQAVKTLAHSKNLAIIDLYGEMVKNKAKDDFLQNDGLHFSRKGYELLASLIVEKLEARLVKKIVEIERNKT